MQVLARKVTKVIGAPKVVKNEIDLSDPYIYKYLTDNKYKISIPYAYLLTEEEILNHGIPDGVDYDKNQPFNHNITIASVNIIKLSDLFINEAPFSLCTLNDALEIVQIIITYLYRWKVYLNEPYSVFEEPPDTTLLYQLDAYKNHLMLYAQYVDKTKCQPIPMRTLTTHNTTQTNQVDDATMVNSTILHEIIAITNQRQRVTSGNLF